MNTKRYRTVLFITYQTCFVEKKRIIKDANFIKTELFLAIKYYINQDNVKKLYFLYYE